MYCLDSPSTTGSQTFIRMFEHNVTPVSVFILYPILIMTYRQVFPTRCCDLENQLELVQMKSSRYCDSYVITQVETVCP